MHIWILCRYIIENKKKNKEKILKASMNKSQITQRNDHSSKSRLLTSKNNDRKCLKITVRP